MKDIEKTMMQKCATGTARTIASGKLSNGKDRLLIYLPASAVEYLGIDKKNNVGFVLYNMNDLNVNAKPGVGMNFPALRRTHKEEVKQMPEAILKKPELKLTPKYDDDFDENEILAIEAYINATEFSKPSVLTKINVQFKEKADKLINEAENRIKAKLPINEIQ